MKGIMMIIMSVKDSENETKEQRGGFLGMLLGILGASLMGNMLAVKGIIRVNSEVTKA